MLDFLVNILLFKRQIGQKVDFKNVQRRVYDALNVLSAMNIIYKDKYNIIYNSHNEHIPIDFPVSVFNKKEKSYIVFLRLRSILFDYYMNMNYLRSVN